jgi:hypothetical protein
MIQKEQFKELQQELEENLEVLHIPKYVWHWREGLIASLFILSICHYQYTHRARRAYKLALEIYG